LAVDRAADQVVALRDDFASDIRKRIAGDDRVPELERADVARPVGEDAAGIARVPRDGATGDDRGALRPDAAVAAPPVTGAGAGIADDRGIAQGERARVVQGATRPVVVVLRERAGGDRRRAGVVEAAAFAGRIVADGSVAQRERAGVRDTGV